MNVQAISLLLLGVALTAMGCKDDGCAMEGDITAGCGLMVDGEPLRLGDTLDLLTEEHGAPTLLDLGASGTRFDLSSAGIAGFCSPDDDTVTSLMAAEEYAGTTEDGLGVGSTAQDVTDSLGAGQAAPYLEGAWYTSLGIGFEITDGAVTKVHVSSTPSGS